MNNQRFEDSSSIFEKCAWGMVIIVILALIVSKVFPWAVDRQLDIDQARLDSHLTPAQRAEVVGR